MATSVWRGYLSFGLLSIPIRLFKAARAERVPLRQVYRVAQEEPASEETIRPMEEKEDEEEAGEVRTAARMQPEPAPVARIRRASVGESAEPIPAAKVLKAFEFDKDRYVPLDAAELKALEAKTAVHMEILEFVKLQEVDPVYFETSYYVRPDPAGEKPYALLFEALRRAGLAGVARFAMHRREHVTLIRSGRRGLLAHTMFYSTEVRAQEEFQADASLVTEKELALAEALVHGLAAPFEPEKYHDTYREKLEALIEAKVARGGGLPTAAPKPASNVVDIVKALEASLSNLRKPPAAASKAPPAKARSRKVSKAG